MAKDHSPEQNFSQKTCPKKASRSDVELQLDRRQLLSAIGGSGVVVLAGCLGDEDPPEETPDGIPIHTVGFLDNDERITVEISEDEVLIYPALEAGVDIPIRCEVGRCGVCTAKYDGDANDVVVHDGNEYLTDTQISDGWVLTCVAYPRDNFDLRVAHPDD